MFTTRWHTSERRYEIVREEGLAVRLSAGFTLAYDMMLPDAAGRWPCVVTLLAGDGGGASAGTESGRQEAEDNGFFVRRGYARAFCRVVGADASGGACDPLGEEAVNAFREALEWLAARPWCDGQVALLGFGESAALATRVAAVGSPALRAVFALCGATDQYRHAVYPGGILALAAELRRANAPSGVRLGRTFRERVGSEEFERRREAALLDPEIACKKELVEALEHPDDGPAAALVEHLLSPLDGPPYTTRAVAWDAGADVPAYFAGQWAPGRVLVDGALESWERWRGPRKLTIGPPLGPDLALLRYGQESLRWFDHWLKGSDTGILEEPPVQLFVQGSGRWRGASTWPVAEARWAELYLRRGGLLSEREPGAGEASVTFFDSPADRGSATFVTPPLDEAVEICGPLVLHLHAATSEREALWFVDVMALAVDGEERMLTRGRLRGSQRRMEPGRSQPWRPWHAHTRRDPLVPGEVTEFVIAVDPVATALEPGARLGVRIGCAEAAAPAPAGAGGCMCGPMCGAGDAAVTVHHSAAHASHLLVPFTVGNRAGI